MTREPIREHLADARRPRPLPGWWHAATASRRLAAARRALPDVLAALVRDGSAPWTPVSSNWTSTGTAVVHLRCAGQAAMLRLSTAGQGRLRRETAVLHSLHSLPLPDDLRRLLPRRLAAGAEAGWEYALDEALVGGSLELLVNTEMWAAVLPSALAAAEALHRTTARPGVIDADRLRHWVDDPLAVVAAAVSALPGLTPPTQVSRLRDLLHRELGGRAVMTSWIHGDFWAGNLLAVPPGTLTGIVDWDLSGDDELPIHDYLHLIVHRRRDVSGADIGDVVRELLAADAWSAEDLAVVARTDWTFPDGMPPTKVLLLLHWLRHVAAVSVQQRSYVTHSVGVWQVRNVHRVLRAL